jgi:CspA family cold shock protein
MPVGTIKKLVADRGFGFIKTERGDLFFHRSSLQEAEFEDLHEGDSVEYTEGSGPKGPRAENVKPA